MITELNTLILFGMGLLTVVAAISLRSRFQRHLVSYDNVLKYAGRKDIYAEPEQVSLRNSSIIPSANTQEALLKKH